jgi:hypothetical protein
MTGKAGEFIGLVCPAHWYDTPDLYLFHRSGRDENIGAAPDEVTSDQPKKTDK